MRLKRGRKIMTRWGHHATGAATGIGVAAYMGLWQVETIVAACICVLAGWKGGVFPDSIEHFRGYYWIKHRTLTHWVPLWVSAAWWLATHPYSNVLPAPELAYPALCAFVTGGLTHLLFDWPNPTGIPWILPWKRHSLKLWQSGRFDLALVILWSAVIASVPVSLT
ncbi:LexA-binding, inner membrane-associated putative hydrolase [Marinobacter nauticus]|uniref:LexA-binding, inner membrane-associated putative hydrolase n=2 Tax=Marinobacter nauticus TaxID=2743 RepID=A0A368X8F7_MARNT|nr:LexA-binding, inner membrane-associated putative hydrolase [Marinobacter nauticus]